MGERGTSGLLLSVGNWNKKELHQFRVSDFKSPEQLQLGFTGGSKDIDPQLSFPCTKRSESRPYSG